MRGMPSSSARAAPISPARVGRPRLRGLLSGTRAGLGSWGRFLRFEILECASAELQEPMGVEVAEESDQRRDEPGPAGLVRRPNAGAVVAVEVLEEENQIAPVRVGLEFFRAAVDGPSTMLVLQEDARKAHFDLFSDLEEGHHPARAGRALHQERGAVERDE